MGKRSGTGLAVFGVLLLGGLAAAAQGTKQWTVGRYEEFARGTPDGVAIRSDGRLEAGPTVATVYDAGGSYVWAVATDAKGTVYAGLGGSTGGSAAAVRLGAGGKAEKIFAGKEMGVQAVRVGRDGAVYAATSPDGKVYRLGAIVGSEQVIFDPSTTAEKPKYLWDLAVGTDGAVYVAAGAPAAVYRVDPHAGGKAELLFRTADQHVRSMLMGANGVLWAGTDGAGVVYRIDTKDRGAKPFAAYASGHREITSLAMDAGGTLYAAAVGAKGAGSLPPLPVTGNVGVTVTFLQPGSATAAGSNGVVPDGSEIDRIAADGTPERLLALKEDVVYGLAVHGGQLLAATGNRGRVYRVDTAVAGRLTEVARLGAGQGTAMAESAGGVVVGTSNGGKVERLSDAPGASSYLSEVFDAGQFARWGRVEVQADAPGFDLFARTGNVPSAVEGWSEWVKVGPNGEAAGMPAGRYAQWRAEMRAGGALDAVTLNYLPRNVAPLVDEVVVAPGARVTGNAGGVQMPTTVQVVFPANAGATAQAISLLQADTNSGPLTAQKDRSAVTVRWSAHDDNGDDLMFAVWYRGVGEANWRVLKDKISDRYLSFDSSLLPDGRYEAKVVASDGPVHTDAETLTGERASAAFTIDTTPPVPGVLTARLEGAAVHWTMEVTDAVSPIGHAEVSVDAGPWQYVEPVGGLSDSRTERYDARALLEDAGTAAGAAVKNPREHVLAVRVYDRAENMTNAKTVVR